jgi:hypothetical protein
MDASLFFDGSKYTQYGENDTPIFHTFLNGMPGPEKAAKGQ